MNVDEFSSFLLQLRQEEQELDNYRTELMRCTEDIEIKINSRRQELKDMVDKHADSLLLELDATRQQNLKKFELNKENIETLLVCLESYNSYCLQLTTVGSASDVCRAKNALDARTKELKHLHISSGNSSYQLSHVSFKITELQDDLRSPDQNIVGELEEHQGQNSGCTKDDYYERSPNAKVDILPDWNLDMEKSTKNTPQQDINRATPIEDEDSKEFLECMEWNLDACVTDSIDLKYLRGITCDEGVTFSTTLETLSNNSRDYEIFGIAILENELFVVSNDNVTVIYDLPTLKFRRRWKVPRDGKYDDIKQCNTNKCLYMMKVESEKHKHNEILRVDPNGNEITAWSVEKARGQLSVTYESNILLTVSSLNELHEYASDGKLVQLICVPWHSGIENPSHAIKLTSDHFLICHGGIGDLLKRVCIMESTGNVLMYFRGQLSNPVYLDIDGVGNILVVYRYDSRVLLLSSNLKFKRNLITHSSHSNEAFTIRTNPRKVCFDKANGRVLVVEHVIKHNSNWKAIKENDAVSVFKI